MEIRDKFLDDILLIESRKFQDDRGSFLKFFEQGILSNYVIRQVNFVSNKTKGIIRGLHFQQPPNSEAKFFRVISGSINLVCLDVRPGSVHFQKSQKYVLKPGNMAVFIPKGYATGYEVMDENTQVLYFSDEDYHPDSESGIRWNDPIIEHCWITSNPIVSEKDSNWKTWPS
jgi:dTDP-4-dehydrorhamnose 3,5-epimerase